MYSPGPYTYGCSVDHSLHTHETLISGPLFVASTLAHTHSTCAHTHREDSHLTLVIKSPLSATQPTAGEMLLLCKERDLSARPLLHWLLKQNADKSQGREQA